MKEKDTRVKCQNVQSTRVKKREKGGNSVNYTIDDLCFGDKKNFGKREVR